MEKKDIEEMRARVGCVALLEREGFAIDRKESTRRAVKFRRDDDIIIVIHDDRGWFDARSDAKGDVFALASHLRGIGFTEALTMVGHLVAFQPTAPTWEKPLYQTQMVAPITDRWNHRKRPWRASATWNYLRQIRALPRQVISAAIDADVLREGPYGSMWAKHVDEAGAVIGWEERGLDWRGFSTGGAKTLFQFEMNDARRICVTEAAIDALSLTAIEQTRSDTLYVSTGGGWSPLTALALENLASGELQPVRQRPGTDCHKVPLSAEIRPSRRRPLSLGWLGGKGALRHRRSVILSHKAAPTRPCPECR